jgi:hypothetical protein
MMMSRTLDLVVLQDCLEDAGFALQAGDRLQAEACLTTARQSLRALAAELVDARSKIKDLEDQLSHISQM